MPGSRSFITAGVLFITGLLLTATACASLFGAVPTRVPTVVPPTMTAMPTETALPLYQQVVLQSAPYQEQGEPFGYTVKAQVPVLVGSQDPRVSNFNAEMKALVDNTIAAFKQNLANLPLTPESTASTFDLHYNVLSPPGSMISIKFDIQTYYSGAAHPGDVSQTITYDLQAGRDVALGDLFIPNADFLTAVSKYCVAQLNTRDIGFQGFELGATATLQNYRNWNITSDGLMITFDEYQVAPYAAGPQTIIIPYKALAPLIRANGPLAGFVR
ncbi:MAG: RsiV family protein [Anaerolineae bacterium]